MLLNDFPKHNDTFKYTVKNDKQSFSSSTSLTRAPCNLENMKWMIQNNFPYDNNDYNKYTRMVNK